MNGRSKEILVGAGEDDSKKTRLRIRTLSTTIALEGLLRVGKIWGVAARAMQVAGGTVDGNADALIALHVCRELTSDDLTWLTAKFLSVTQVFRPLKQGADGAVVGDWRDLAVDTHLDLIGAAQWIVQAMQLSYADFFVGGALSKLLDHDPTVPPIL